MKKCIKRLLIIISGALILFTQYDRILTLYAGYFTVNTATKGADALIVLSGGIFSRLPFAFKLYKEGYASQILLTQEVPTNPLYGVNIPSQKEVIRKMAAFFKSDAPLSIIGSSKGGARSTFDEAYDLKKYIHDQNIRHVILVTDEFHTRRALYAFKKVLNDRDIKIEAIGATNAIFNKTNWWKSDIGISTYLLEGIKYGVYLFSTRNPSFLENY